MFKTFFIQDNILWFGDKICDPGFLWSSRIKWSSPFLRRCSTTSLETILALICCVGHTLHTRTHFTYYHVQTLFCFHSHFSWIFFLIFNQSNFITSKYDVTAQLYEYIGKPSTDASRIRLFSILLSGNLPKPFPSIWNLLLCSISWFTEFLYDL